MGPPEPTRAARVVLADEKGPLAWLSFDDAPRPGAHELIARLRAMGRDVHLLSGDPDTAAVVRFARGVGIARWVAGATPEEKLRYVTRLAAAGRHVAVIGDGVNDATVLGAASVSIAMGSGADLAQTAADAVLLSNRLEDLATGLAHAHRTRSVVRQNLTWALVYNAAALPLAAAGYVSPYLAAIGMAASSLLVVLNAMRLRRVPDVPA